MREYWFNSKDGSYLEEAGLKSESESSGSGLQISRQGTKRIHNVTAGFEGENSMTSDLELFCLRTFCDTQQLTSQRQSKVSGHEVYLSVVWVVMKKYVVVADDG